MTRTYSRSVQFDQRQRDDLRVRNLALQQITMALTYDNVAPSTSPTLPLSSWWSSFNLTDLILHTPPDDCIVVSFSKSSSPRGDTEDLVSNETVQRYRRVVNAYLLTLFFFVSVPCNIVNMIVFWKHGIKERINLCLFSLSFVDLMTVLAHFTWNVGCVSESYPCSVTSASFSCSCCCCCRRRRHCCFVVFLLLLFLLLLLRFRLLLFLSFPSSFSSSFFVFFLLPFLLILLFLLLLPLFYFFTKLLLLLLLIILLLFLPLLFLLLFVLRFLLFLSFSSRFSAAPAAAVTVIWGRDYVIYPFLTGIKLPTPHPSPWQLRSEVFNSGKQSRSPLSLAMAPSSPPPPLPAPSY